MVSAKVTALNEGLTVSELTYSKCSVVHYTDAVKHTNVAKMPDTSRLEPQFHTINGTDCQAGTLVFNGTTHPSHSPPPYGTQDIYKGQISATPSSPKKLEISYWYRFVGMEQGMLRERLKVTGGPGTSEQSGEWVLFAPPPALHVQTHVQIQSAETGRCLTAPAGKTQTGSLVSMETCSGSDWQAWDFTQGELRYVGNGASAEGTCVQPMGGNTMNTVFLEMTNCSGSPSQQWLVDANLGTIYLAAMSKAEPLKCMDLRNGGDAVQIYDCMYGAWNQQLIIHGLQKIPAVELVV